MVIKCTSFWRIIFSIICLFFLQQGFAQYNVIKIDPLALLVQNPLGLRISYEHSFGNHFSLLATMERGRYDNGQSGSGSSGTTVTMYTVYEVTGWGFMPEARYYPFTKRKPAPLGFFVGAHYRYRILQEEYHDNGINITSHGHAHDIGLNAGYKVGAGRFIFDFLAGYGAGGGKWTSSTGDRSMIDSFFRDDFTDFTNFIRLEASVGFTFPKVKRKDGR